MRQRTILLAEDDQGIRDLLCYVLGRHGFSVLPAKDGAEAVEIAGSQTDQIDLLLADINMPKITGVDLARRVGRMRPDLPVLLMSGELDGLDVLKPGWHFLEKPFRPSKLLAAVDLVLEKT